MNVEYANVFIRSALSVFTKEVKINLSRKDLYKKNTPSPSMPIAIVLGLTGFVRGQVVFSMDEEFALSVTRAMVPNILPAQSKQLMNSAISEIANMITGQASISLAGGQEKIDLTPPMVIVSPAPGMSIDFLDTPTISLSLLSEIGVLEINIALIDNEV